MMTRKRFFSMLVATSVAATSIFFAGAAFAQQAPSITAVLGPQPDSHVVSGTGFDPGTAINVFDGSGCGGVERCPGDNVVGRATTNATGAFSVTVQLDPNQQFAAGQTHRLLEAAQADWTPAELGTRPTVQVALHHNGATPAPGAPNTGGGSLGIAGGNGNETAIHVGLAMALAALLTLAFAARGTRAR